MSQRDASARPMSHPLENKLSQHVAESESATSRPSSAVGPVFPSSLPYTSVRDFAYPVSHSMHYGPPPDLSGSPLGSSTPTSERAAFADSSSWEQTMPWDSWNADSFNRGLEIPPIQFGDGPPYSEDEDLQSPVVSSRHRKHKSTSATLQPGRGRAGRHSQTRAPSYDHERGGHADASANGGQRYYIDQEGEANGPGGEYVTYPPEQIRHSHAYRTSHQPSRDRRGGSDNSDSPASTGYLDVDESRYSRDYQFTITSPDEEFHGKAVALFDFERENENELPLVEGQIIWVSYRHGQGWLVAEDPKTEESGLVPEEYVRLLRDIEGGMNSLAGQVRDAAGSPNDGGTPTQAEHGQFCSSAATANSANGYHQPVVSMFSTSSKDLNPYPTQGLQAGQLPPQVIHYHGQRGGSQANTPTLTQTHDAGALRRGSQGTGSADDMDATLEREAVPADAELREKEAVNTGPSALLRNQEEQEVELKGAQ